MINYKLGFFPFFLLLSYASIVQNYDSLEVSDSIAHECVPHSRVFLILQVRNRNRNLYYYNTGVLYDDGGGGSRLSLV